MSERMRLRFRDRYEVEGAKGLLGAASWLDRDGTRRPMSRDGRL
jgi:hypothetical protein